MSSIFSNSVAAVQLVGRDRSCASSVVRNAKLALRRIANRGWSSSATDHFLGPGAFESFESSIYWTAAAVAF
jgi:hypothetical protein